MISIKVRLPVLFCAVKTVEGDFRFCWMISPNVGQTHKENPNLVRIFYMTFTLNDIYKQYNKLHDIDAQKSVHFAVPRIETRLKKCIRLVYEIQVICRALQAMYSSQY